MLYSPPRPTWSRRIRSRIRDLEIGFHPVVGGLMLVAFGFHMLTFQEERWWGDSYQYLLHAENLLSGQAYADTGYVPSPYSFLAPAAYPPGYPLLLVPLISVFGASPQMLAMVASIFLLGTAWVTATLARSWIPDSFAIAIAVLIALQPGLIAVSRQPLSDPQFLFFVMLCLLAADRASYKTTTWNRRVVLAGAAFGAALVTQTAGLALLPALLLPNLIRHRRLSRSALAVAGLGLGLWGLASLIPLGSPALSGAGLASEDALTDQTGLLSLSEIPGQIVYYVRATFPLWQVPRVDALKNLLFAVALIPVGLGFAYRVRRRLGPAEAFAILYALALLVWTATGTRSLTPLYPLYYMYLVVGVWWIGRDSLGRQWAVNAALVIAVGLSYGTRYLDWAVGPPTTIVPEDTAELYQFMRASTPDTAIAVATQDPRPVTYYARRQVSRGPNDVEEWSTYADRLGATYALVHDGSPIAPDLLRDARHQLVRRDGPLSLYRICETPCEPESP